MSDLYSDAQIKRSEIQINSLQVHSVQTDFCFEAVMSDHLSLLCLGQLGCRKTNKTCSGERSSSVSIIFCLQSFPKPFKLQDKVARLTFVFNGSHSWTSGVSQSSAVVSVFYPAAATKTSADTSRNSAVQLFSPYFNFLMWLWLLWLLLKHPNHELRKKQELNYQTGKQKEARQRSVDVARRT